MPRVYGVTISGDKSTHIALQSIYGVGSRSAVSMCQSLGIDPERKARLLSENELAKLSDYLENQVFVEGQLRRFQKQNIERLKSINSSKGRWHRKNDR